MNQSSSQPTQSKTAAAGAFATSSIVAVLVTHYVARSLFRIVMPKNSDLPDQMKQTGMSHSLLKLLLVSDHKQANG